MKHLFALGLIAVSAFLAFSIYPASAAPNTSTEAAAKQSNQAAAAAKNPTLVTEKQSGQTISVSKSTIVEIRLDGNITTGYSWEVSQISGQSASQQGKVQYLNAPHAPNVVGSGGTFVATFKADQAGLTSITLVYHRPWEKNKAPAKTFTVKVNVTP